MFRGLLTTSTLLLLLLASPASATTYKVCIDPGHGGSDPGAVGCGLQEAAVNLQVGHLLKDLMAADPELNPIMTRTTDATVSLQGRCDYANDNGADRFASIHCNAFNGSATGIETFAYTYGSNASFDQRDRIQDKMTDTWPALTDRGGKTANFYVIKYTSMPSTLSELAFIDNCGNDATYLGDPEERQAAAYAHYLAIKESLGLTGGTVDPPDQKGKLLGAVFEDQGVGTADMSIRLAGASVTAQGDNGVTVSGTAEGEDAMWAFSVEPGTYSVTATYADHYANTRVCSVTAGGETWCSIGLLPEENTEPPPAEAGTLLGAVFEDQGVGTADMSLRLPGATITVIGSDGYSDTLQAVAPAGMFETAVPAGTYTVKAGYSGYWDNERVCVVKAGLETWCSIGLMVDGGSNPVDPPPSQLGTLTGLVYEDQVGDEMLVAIAGATVRADGANGYQKSTTASVPNGLYELELPTGKYLVTGQHGSYWSVTRECAVMAGQETWCSLGLKSKFAPKVIDDADVTPAEGESDIVGEGEEDTGTGGLTVAGADDESAGGGCTAGPVGAAGAGWLVLLLVGLLAGVRRRTAAPALLAVWMAMPTPTQAQEPAGQSQAQPLAVFELAQRTEAAGYCQPDWSLQADWLSFTEEGFGALYVLGAGETQPREVARGRRVGYGHRWLPDGRAIAVRNANQRLSDVAMRSVTVAGEPGRTPRNRTPGRWAEATDEGAWFRRGAEARKVHRVGDRYCCAELDPSGRRMVFQGLTSGLYVHDWDAGVTVALGPGNHGRFNADGSALLFDTCTDDGEELTACTLYLVLFGAQGPVIRSLTGLPERARFPAFGPTAHGLQAIVFSADGAVWTATIKMPRK